MLFPELLSTVTNVPLPAREISSVTEDTRRADANSLFVCIRGARFDGHALAVRAYENGCRCFVAEEPLALPTDATVVLVPNTRVALSRIACVFYKNPSRELRVIGITGTKGKTTTASLIREVLNTCGIPCGYIGTNGIFYGDVKIATLNTTPDAVTLQRTLANMRDAGMHAVVMEVSSQALLQERVGGTHFEATVFTNFSKDHIGPNEHPTLENYLSCKHRLFTDFEAQLTIWNNDDPSTRILKKGAVAKRHLHYSALGNDADLQAHDVFPSKSGVTLGISFALTNKNKKERVKCHLPLIGTCNVSNALCAAAVATEMFGLTIEETASALSHAHVLGRSECYPLPSGAIAVIDYAHNRESLSQVLTALREYHPTRLYCLFGSVGERTQLRRRDLAEVAGALSDECILTSDNPGNEPTEQILEEIAAYLPKGFPYTKIADRKDAIRYALQKAKNGDILLLAGKGHENYQLIGNEKIPFDERKVIRELLVEPTPV